MVMVFRIDPTLMVAMAYPPPLRCQRYGFTKSKSRSETNTVPVLFGSNILFVMMPLLCCPCVRANGLHNSPAHILGEWQVCQLTQRAPSRWSDMIPRLGAVLVFPSNHPPVEELIAQRHECRVIDALGATF